MFNLKSTQTQAIAIWDSELICDLQTQPILLWRQFVGADSNETTVSICDIVDQNSSEIRNKILTYISAVQSSISNNPHTSFEFRENFDYFWMTQFHSRPYTQSAELTNLAKFFALTEIVKENKTQQLTIYTNNEKLVRVFRNFAKSLKIEIKIIKIDSIKLPVFEQAVIKSLVPRLLLAILALITQIKISLALGRAEKQPSKNATISVFDYWYRFSPNIKSNQFGSQYWTTLVDHLDQTQVHWWHNLVDQHKRSELKTARHQRTGFNSHQSHHHEITDAKFDFRILFRTLIDYFRVFGSSVPANKYHQSFIDPVSGTNFWPLFKREWLNSLRGYEAMINCIRFSRLESLVSTMNPQTYGVYLIENQPWEMALIYLWRNYNHGKLIGVAHSTIRYWDLRLMSDKKQFANTSKMPRPDLLAVNGALAKESILATGYPTSEVVDVEALMYLHLKTSQVSRASNSKITILVATDFLESATKAQIKLLSEVVHGSPNRYQILLKPHWSQKLDDLDFDATTVSGKQDLSSYFNQVDVLYCSAITSAVIDGACSGLPVIQCLDPMSLNLSPLRGNPAIQTVRTSAELSKALQQIDSHTAGIDADTLFHLDASIPLWKNLLKS